MKWLERTIWVALVVVLSMGSLVLWALWRSTGEVSGREQYMNYVSRLNLQQQLDEGRFETAASSNREWLTMWWGIYQKQDQYGQLLISERDFKMLSDKLAASQPEIGAQE